jgi:glycosyltransferase involved in cell wall biosynthesis
MHVCFFNRSYWPDVTATGQYLTELAQDLVARHGCEVTVVAGQPLTVATERTWALSTTEIHNGVRVIRANGTHFRPRRFAGRAANYLSYFLAAAVASLRVRRPDVVVAFTDPPIIGLLALATARRGGAKFVFRCTDIFPEVAALLEDFHSDRVDQVLDRINRYLIAHADLTVAIGSRMRRRLVEEKGADGSNLPIIHDWADCEAITPGTKDNAFSRGHGLHDRFVVMHSGNVGASQNLDMLVEAAHRLRDRDDIVFAIVGDGIRRARLEASASARALRNIKFLPYQPKERLDESFGAADAFVVSLKPGLEGYIVPSKIYGTLAAGRPFIAAVDESCEVAEIAREHRCGVVVPPGDVEAFVAAVLKLRDDPDGRAAMGRRARDAAWQFDRRRAIAAYADLFKMLVAPAPAPAHQHQHPSHQHQHEHPL